MAAAVDAHVTVKQHGFHVKQPLGSAALAASSSEAGGSAREEGGAAARGLLSFAPPPLAAQAVQAALVVPPGSGCLEPADHAHLTPGVKRLMKSVVRGMKAFQVRSPRPASHASAVPHVLLLTPRHAAWRRCRGARFAAAPKLPAAACPP